MNEVQSRLTDETKAEQGFDEVNCEAAWYMKNRNSEISLLGSNVKFNIRRKLNSCIGYNLAK